MNIEYITTEHKAYWPWCTIPELLEELVDTDDHIEYLLGSANGPGSLQLIDRCCLCKKLLLLESLQKLACYKLFLKLVQSMLLYKVL